MKVPIQKTEKKVEPVSSEIELWPTVRSLAGKYFPEEWLMRPWSDSGKGLYREMESWMPKVDISETDKEFEISVDVPGVKPEDVKVEVAGDNLVISGKSEEKTEDMGKTWHRIERKAGSFYREFELPKTADPERIEASIKNGILGVKLMKKPGAESRIIEIKTE